jgi:hypothetical protein
MPHLVEMHNKYSKDGLATITVCIDDLQELPEAKASAPKILKAKGATATTNLMLDEPYDVWSKKLRFIASPCIYVFDRQGKWTQFISDKTPIDHDAVEKLVLEALKAK